MAVILAPIAFTNSVLLVGLHALDWAPGTIAFLFWFEAAVIGAFTFIKVAASLPGDVPGAKKSVTYVRLPRPGERTRVSSSVPRVNAFAALPLFVVFYGVLLAGYGALLLFSLKEPNYPALARSAPATDSVRLAMALIVGQHLWFFWRDYVRGPVWQRSDPTFHFWKPFGLAIITWLAFYFGALVDAQAGEWFRTDDST